MRGVKRKPGKPVEWTYRVLYDGSDAVIEYGDYSVSLLTDEDSCKCGNLPSDDFVVPVEFAQQMCKLLNTLYWGPSQ